MIQCTKTRRRLGHDYFTTEKGKIILENWRISKIPINGVNIIPVRKNAKKVLKFFSFIEQI